MQSKLIKLFAVFLMLGCFACGSDDDGGMVQPMPEPEMEPTSLRIGLLAHFAFEGNADDLSSNAYTGTVVGATVTADRNGEPNGAYYFDGIDDHINYGNLTDLALGGAQPYTMAAWVKPEQLDNPDSRSIIISKFNGGVAAGWYLAINGNATVAAYRNVAPWATFGIGAVDWSEYVHVASTYDGTALKVYINGIEDNSVNFGTHPNDRTTNVTVGAIYSQNNLVPAFRGNIDEVRIYNRVLEPEELTWLAEN
ncbi:MAG: LamG domain-containing protein [Bacteroidota bacterium]